MTGETTSSSTSAALADAIFDEHIVALARDATLGLAFAPEPAGDSYFRPARRPVMDRAAMQAQGAEGTLATLAGLWQGQLAPLSRLTGPLDTLAGVIANERAQGAADPDAPSTLVYQMW